VSILHSRFLGTRRIQIVRVKNPEVFPYAAGPPFGISIAAKDIEQSEHVTIPPIDAVVVTNFLSIRFRKGASHVESHCEARQDGFGPKDGRLLAVW
jgi:hypothetical protein